MVNGYSDGGQGQADSAKVFNQLKCTKLGSGSLTLFPDTQLYEEERVGCSTTWPNANALSDDELEGISGGSWCPTECGDLSERCKSLGDLKW